MFSILKGGITMGFIILGLIFIVIGLFIARAFMERRSGPSFLWALFATIPIALGIFGIIFGVIMPTGEYKPMEEVKTVELESLIDDPIILINRDMIEYNSYSSISIVEEENCTNPRLVEYSQEREPTFWSFGLMNKKTIYIIYLPKGIIGQ